jgi:hypothetical protein
MYEFLLQRTNFDKCHDLSLPCQFPAAISEIGRKQEEDFFIEQVEGRNRAKKNQHFHKAEIIALSGCR